MHLYFLTRGIKQQRDIFVNFLQTQMWKWKRKNLKTKKEEISRVQGALRPVELWEYVFPEECLDEVLTCLNITKDNLGTPKTFATKTKLSALRKMCGAKKIKSYKKVPTSNFISTAGVSIHPIGIKKDRREKNKKIGYEQEML